jgi:hypothetical protein
MSIDAKIQTSVSTAGCLPRRYHPNSDDATDSERVLPTSHRCGLFQTFGSSFQIRDRKIKSLIVVHQLWLEYSHRLASLLAF